MVTVPSVVKTMLIALQMSTWAQYVSTIPPITSLTCSVDKQLCPWMTQQLFTL